MTASRAINGTGYVAQVTIARIKKIADKHRYRPNLLIRGVQTGRTMTIGVIFPADLGFYTNVLEGIHDELLANQYGIQLSLVKKHFGAQAAQQEHDQILRMLDLRVDGIILRPVNDNATSLYFKEVFKRKIPLVTIDRKLEKVQCDFAGSDDFYAGKKAAEYLIEQGHRDILLVATGDSVSTGRERRDGFLAFTKEQAKKIRVVVINEPDFKHHEPEVLRALTTHPGITAAFCVSDTLTPGLYHTAGKLGKKIPGDLSILGFGNLEFGPYLSPALSTFDQHPDCIGKTAVEMLLKRLGSQTPGKYHRNLIPADLLLRDSVGSIETKK